MKFDVIVVGAGPAGIFSAFELTKDSELNVLILDKGLDIDQRKRPANGNLERGRPDPSMLLSGWGGAGAFSDGKLTLSTETGGWLTDYRARGELEELIDYVDDIYVKFGAPKHLYGFDVDKIDDIERRASLVGLKLVQQKIRHMGTENCADTLSKLRKHLNEKVEVRTGADVKGLLVSRDRIEGVELVDGEKVLAKYVIVAPGRGGAEWLKCEAQSLGLKTLNNPVDVGIRVEVLSSVMAGLTDVLYEPKFIYYSKCFDDKVRTFCVAPEGEVIAESYDGILTVNGQSYAERKTGNTNFAILVTTSFTEPFREPIAYGEYLARLTNLLGGGVIVQRLGDLQAGRRSTEERMERSVVVPTLKSATPGDLSFVLPYRYLADIREMLEALDRIAPGVNSKHTLLYGVEVKFYSTKLQLSDCLETKISNLFTIGDGAGVTRGLVQASASGVIAAREILRREKQRADY